MAGGCRDRDGAGVTAFPPSLLIQPVSRWPTTLPEATARAVLSRPVPGFPRHRAGPPAGRPAVSVIVVTYNGLLYTRMCLEGLLANTDRPGYEVLVVDNGSGDGTRDYLAALAAANPVVRVLFNDRNLGFARANNQGLGMARGEILVLLNND